MTHVNKQQVEASVRQWVDTFVVGLNLCPFAKAELVRKRVHFAVSEATGEQALLEDMARECERLDLDEDIETTLLIIPGMLHHFPDYNQFLDLADGLLEQMGLDGVYQLATFHPGYQFAGTGPEDAENYTNRSPYPVLHLLREVSLDRVLGDDPDADRIPQRNIDLMNRMGTEKLRALLDACFS